MYWVILKFFVQKRNGVFQFKFHTFFQQKIRGYKVRGGGRYQARGEENQVEEGMVKGKGRTKVGKGNGKEGKGEEGKGKWKL